MNASRMPDSAPKARRPWRLRRLPGPVRSAQSLRVTKASAGVLALAGEAEAQHADHALHLGLLEHEALDLLHHGQRALLRGAGRQLHVDEHVALVFVGRNEVGRRMYTTATAATMAT
jgi:hypothetical protein